MGVLIKTPHDLAICDFIVLSKPPDVFLFPGGAQYQSVSSSLPAAHEHFLVSV